MRKIISLLIAVAMLLPMTVAFATTYENAAFIGSWVARGTDGEINARLFVDFCDSERIKCRFNSIKSGEVQREYEIYQTNINDTKAQGTFSTTNSINNWYPSGNCYIELKGDMIEFSMVANNGVKIYEGLFKSESTEFEPHTSPYNENVHINLNSQPIKTELSPFILKHRTFVPLRGVFEAMGINVEWFDTKEDGVHTHEIRATRGDITVSIARENKNEKGFGSWSLTKTHLGAVTEVDLSEVQPVIINDYTFVPLRVIVESFDTLINWDDPTRTVVITDDKAPQKDDLTTDTLVGDDAHIVPPTEDDATTDTPVGDDAHIVPPAEDDTTTDTIVEDETPATPPTEETTPDSGVTESEMQ